MLYDVAIVGASVAGSTAAYLLGKQGLRVALIDKVAFPRRKPCGEGLSKAGVTILRRCGLESVLAATPHLAFRGYRLSTGTRSCILTTPHSGGVTLQRERFDLALLDAALTHPTVVPYLREQVTRIDPSGIVWVSGKEIRTRSIVLATGANSPLVKGLGLPEISYGKQRAGITATFTGTFQQPPDLVHIAILPSCEIYATPLPNDKLNVNILADYPCTHNIRAHLLAPETLRQIALPFGFSGEMTLAPLGRAPLGNRARKASLQRTFLIGDAAEEFDPIGGMGMTHALRSAELVSQAIGSIFAADISASQAMSVYDQQRAASADTMRLFTKLCYHSLRLSARVPAFLHLASSPIGRFMTDHFSYGGT